MERPRLGVLNALQDAPESLWNPLLWALLAKLEDLRTEGFHGDFAALQIKAAIQAEFKAEDEAMPRGTPDRP